MVSPLLQQPISDLARLYYARVKKVNKQKSKQPSPTRLFPFTWEDIYSELANQATPQEKVPLVIGLKLAPKLVAPVYIGAKLGKLVGTAGAQGAFGSGPVAGLDYTPEIAEYERSALGSSRII